MTPQELRDWFAGTCPSDLARVEVKEHKRNIAGPQPPMDDFPAILAWNMRIEAYLRYAYADAMLAERYRK